MRYQPLRIDRIPRKAASKLVVNPTSSHVIAGGQHHANGFVILETFGVAQQKLWMAGLGKFWRIAKTAVTRIVRALELASRISQNIGRQNDRRQTLVCAGLFQARVNFRGGIGQFTMACLPKLLNLLEHLQKAWPSIARLRRKISSAKER